MFERVGGRCVCARVRMGWERKKTSSLGQSPGGYIFDFTFIKSGRCLRLHLHPTSQMDFMATSNGVHTFQEKDSRD